MTRCGPRTRSRSGCFGCRYRKKKCDGVRPQCSYCLERGQPCRYGLKASFHPSRQMRLSAEDRSALCALEEQRGSISRSMTQFVDNTAQIVQGYQEDQNVHTELVESGERSRSESNGVHEQPIFLTEDIASQATSVQWSVSSGAASSTEAGATTTTTIEGSTYSDFGIRSYDQATAPNLSPLLCPQASFVAPAYFNVDLPVSELEQIQLIRAYVQSTGTWCETTDPGRHFTVSHIHSLLNNKPFAAAAMALASRHLDAIHRVTSDSTLNLYQHAVQSLLHYEPSQCGEATLVCCILLSVYEMMTSDVAEWRRHLKGCVFNLINKGWNGSSAALVGASFWAFARIDLWAAYLLEERTLVPPENWLSHEEATSHEITEESGNYCNLTTLLLAKIINLLAGSVQDCRDEINALWSNLQIWQSRRPLQMLPLLRVDSGLNRPFPMILHAGDPSTSGNLLYHTGCILLLRTGQVDRRTEDDMQNAIWHAKEVCGISTTNASHASWVNQVYPLYIAGRAFETTLDKEDGEEYAAEKVALLKHLAKIERETGWPTASKATALRKLWGLE